MPHRIKKSGQKTVKSFTLGRAGFAKISAVEGIRLTAAMDREFEDFDRRGLTAAERRRNISRKYAKAR